MPLTTFAVQRFTYAAFREMRVFQSSTCGVTCLLYDRYNGQVIAAVKLPVRITTLLWTRAPVRDSYILAHPCVDCKPFFGFFKVKYCTKNRYCFCAVLLMNVFLLYNGNFFCFLVWCGYVAVDKSVCSYQQSADKLLYYYNNTIKGTAGKTFLTIIQTTKQ